MEHLISQAKVSYADDQLAVSCDDALSCDDVASNCAASDCVGDWLDDLKMVCHSPSLRKETNKSEPTTPATPVYRNSPKGQSNLCQFLKQLESGKTIADKAFDRLGGQTHAYAS